MTAMMDYCSPPSIRAAYCTAVGHLAVEVFVADLVVPNENQLSQCLSF